MRMVFVYVIKEGIRGGDWGGLTNSIGRMAMDCTQVDKLGRRWWG